jgi:hypothetical protein
MACAESVTCDVCGRVKGEANHRLIATSPVGHSGSVGFGLSKDRRYAEAEGPLIEDICGADCAHKRLQRALDLMNAPTTSQEPSQLTYSERRDK